MNPQNLILAAATAGDIETAQEILEQTPTLVHYQSTDGWTPLHLAARAGHCTMAELLLAHGADVDARARNGLGNTPLLGAILGQQMDMVILLIARGAQVNIPNTAGATPLHKAAIQGNASLVRLLLAHGAQADARNSGGQTPLVHALYHGHAEIAQLLERGTVTADAGRERPTEGLA